MNTLTIIPKANREAGLPAMHNLLTLHMVLSITLIV